jgi:hypothetical protein
MPVDEQGDPFALAELLVQDLFRDSLDGKQPPAGFRLWGYKLVRSDRRAGGELSWPDEDGVLAETVLSDGYHGGVTDPGTLAIAPNLADVALTSAVGGSVLLTLAYNPEDVIEARDTGLVLVRRAHVADADIIAQNLSRGIFRDARYRALDSVDVSGLQDRERASFLGPEPLQHPGLDARPRAGARPGDGWDWLAAAVAVYRQPPNDPYDLALALAQVAHDEAARKRLAEVHVATSILQFALPWERQVAVQRRVDGYLLEQFCRVDPRAEDPGRPIGRAKQWLHTFPYGTQFLNLAETLIEYDIDYDDLAAGPLPFVQRLLPKPRRGASRAEPPSLTPGPAYQVYPGLAGDEVPRWPELTAVYLPATGEPRMIRLEANGPCSSRERQRLLGGPVTYVQLDAETRMLLQGGAPGEAAVNAVATALLSRYPEATPAEQVRGGVLLAGALSDGTEADAPGSVIEHLASLGHPVVPREDSP